MSAPVRIGIIDKNPLVRNGLAALIGAEPDAVLVGHWPDVPSWQADGAQPDVLVIGWEMPKISGRELLMMLAAQGHGPRVVVYTGAHDPNIPADARAAGAMGFVHKSTDEALAIASFIRVGRGEMVFPAPVARAESVLDQLTPRERQLLMALAEGATNTAIAETLGVTVNTIKFHLRNLYDKLDVRNRAQAVALFLTESRR